MSRGPGADCRSTAFTKAGSTSSSTNTTLPLATPAANGSRWIISAFMTRSMIPWSCGGSTCTPPAQ